MSVIHYQADQLGAMHACARAAVNGLGLPRAPEINRGILDFLARYAQDNAAIFSARYREPTWPVERSAIAAASLAYGATPERCREVFDSLGGGLAYQLAERGVPESLIASVRERENTLRDLIDRWAADAPPAPAPARPEPLSREDAIKRIRNGLRARTGRSWSVTGGRGTSYSWLTIDAPPKRRTCDADGAPAPETRTRSGQVAERYMCAADREALARALAKDWIHPQGESVPPGAGCREEYIDRAEGRPPSRECQRDWD